MKFINVFAKSARKPKYRDFRALIVTLKAGSTKVLIARAETLKTGLCSMTMLPPRLSRAIGLGCCQKAQNFHAMLTGGG